MDNSSAAFTVPFPEARKARAARLSAVIFLLLYWILWGIGLNGPPETARLPWQAIAMIPLTLFLTCLIYEWRTHKKLVPLINQRFAEELFNRTQQVYPEDVDILKVQRSVAAKRVDGSISLWGVERKKDAIHAFPLD